MTGPPHAILDGTERDRWRARVHAGGGAVLGAGVILDERHVLTCAHVVPADAHLRPEADQLDWTLTVHAVGVGSEHRRARVAMDGWIPRQDNDDHVQVGDLAILELEDPLPAGLGAPLHHVSARRGTQVWAYGFPRGKAGVWAKTLIQGFSGELLQVDALAGRGAEVERGFSGAGVVDGFGRVVGLVMSKLVDERQGIAWIMPVETITRYLPTLNAYVTDLPRSDASIPALQDPDDETRSGVRVIIDYLGSSETRVLVLVGDQGNHRTGVISLLTQSGTLAPRSLVDVAFSAAGMTAGQVATRIAVDLQLSATSPGQLIEQLQAAETPVTVVLDRVDDAVDPGAVMSSVLIPITEMPSRGGKVVVGVRQDTQISSRGTTSLRLTGGARTQTFAERLDRLELQINDLRALEPRALAVACVFTNTTVPQPRASRLRIRLAMLHQIGEGPEAFARLKQTEESASRALRRARRVIFRDERRRELSGRLDAYQAKASASVHAENILLAAFFDQAADDLQSSPCDLTDCAVAVDAYQAALWRLLGLEPAQEAGDAS